MEVEWRDTAGDGGYLNMYTERGFTAYILKTDRTFAYIKRDGLIEDGQFEGTLEDCRRYVETLVRLEWA